MGGPKAMRNRSEKPPPATLKFEQDW